MIEVRIHGRGGQGVVVAADLLAVALAKEGKYVQSFPTFGPERRSAPVTAFLRMADTPIRLRCEIYNPDHLMVFAPNLLVTGNVVSGLREGGCVVINSNKEPENFAFLRRYRVVTIDASGISAKHKLGARTSPIVNTSMVGAFAKITGLVGIESIIEAIQEAIPSNREVNIAIARESYEKACYRLQDRSGDATCGYLHGDSGVQQDGVMATS